MTGETTETGTDSRWRRWRAALLAPRLDAAAVAAACDKARQRHALPVVWLLGKTQAGKTSIVRALTGSSRAEVGNGFQPCTRSASLYDFPAQVPVVRFLDTRGLGEVGYDATADLRAAEASAHLVLGVMKALDTEQAALREALREVRRRHPEWPVILVQTAVHEGYADDRDSHPQPYPFADPHWPTRVPGDLARALLAQRAAFGTLPGAGPQPWVVVDLTLPEDGYRPPDYGLEPLWQTIEQASSLQLRALLQGDDDLQDLTARAAHPHILGYAVAAGALGALPLVDVAAVPALQAKLLQSLASLYGQPWDRRAVGELLGLLGTGFGVTLGLKAAGRSLIKLIPGWGQTLGALWGATASGATTYALGKAAVYHLAQRQRGQPTSAAVLRQRYAEALARGAALVREQLRRPAA